MIQAIGRAGIDRMSPDPSAPAQRAEALGSAARPLPPKRSGAAGAKSTPQRFAP